MTWLENLTLSDWGNVSSIAGLGVTLFVAWSVRRLRQQYSFKARLPQILHKLSERASALSSLLNDFERNRGDIQLELSQTKPLLKSLRSKLSRAQRKSCKNLNAEIDLALRVPVYRKSVWNVYVSIQTLIQELEELNQDLEWER